MSQKSYSDIIRKWSRLLHRDLSFFFAGILMIYAISGFMLNHKKDFNSDYLIRQKQIRFTEPIPANPQEINREFAERLLKTIGEENRYLKHYSPEPGCIKIFIKGGSSLVIHTESGEGIYESIKKRPVISWFNRLHYNPSHWCIFRYFHFVSTDNYLHWFDYDQRPQRFLGTRRDRIRTRFAHSYRVHILFLIFKSQK